MAAAADDLSTWISGLPSPAPFTIVYSPCGRSILLTSDLHSLTASTTFSISLTAPAKTLWISDHIPCSAASPHLLLLLQLLHESITVAPFPHHTLLPKPDPARLLTLDPTPDMPAVLLLTLLCRLFWLCAGESYADAGLLFFGSFDAALVAAFNCRRSLGSVLLAVGADREERFMRSVGYMVAKWCVLRELSSRSEINRLTVGGNVAYAAEVHGLWIMKGYAPVLAMSRIRGGGTCRTIGSPRVDPKEAALRYALAHQQLELAVQLDYAICGRDPRFLKIVVRVDNIRIHVARLVFGKSESNNDVDVNGHFVSRVRVLVGPEAGASYAVGPSLGRSTRNPERVVEATRTLKGGFGFQRGGSGAGVRVKTRWSTNVRQRSWRWEQEAEGGAAVFDGVLCDAESGREILGRHITAGMRQNYNGRGLVIAGDELPEVVGWRVGREMEGQRVKWRIGGRVWVSYLPNEARNGYFDARWVEWEEEVEFTMVAGIFSGGGG